jgi:hypothetical protein
MAAMYQNSGLSAYPFTPWRILESVLKIIGQGPGTNLLIHENFHLSINANGTLTALIDNSSFHKGNSAQVNVVDVLCKKRKPNLQCQS